MKQLTAKTLYQGHIFRVEEREYSLRGKKITRSVVVHPGAVVIIPLHSNGCISLVRQYRHSVSSEIFELPAGTLEAGEEPQVCAIRELAEECNLAAKRWKYLGALYPAPGFCNEIQHVFLATELSESCASLDEDEVLEPIVVPKNQINELLFSGKVIDGKTLAALYLLQAQGEEVAN